MKVKLSLRLVYLGLFLVFLGLFVMGALLSYYTPYSGRAYLEHGMAPVFSRVGGVMVKIYRANGDRVVAGDRLFQLDDRNFRAEVQRLEALYDTAVTQLETLDFQIQEEQENHLKAEKTLEQCRLDDERDRKLLAKRAVSAKNAEASHLKYEVARQELAAIGAKLAALKRQRGDSTAENSELKRIRAELDIARNNCADTVIGAPISGILSYHQLYVGQAVGLDQKYAVVHDLEYFTVNVDLMEKSVGRLRIGQRALIAFDAIPGRIFQGRIQGFVRELESGYTAPNQFNRIEEDTRWIRAVGRNRVQLTLDEQLPEEVAMATGARAAVVVLHPDCPWLNRIARGWIRLICLGNYIY